MRRTAGNRPWGLLCALVATYVGFVLTSRGQRFDNHAKLYSSVHSLPRRFARDGIPSFKIAASAVAAFSALVLVGAISVWAQRNVVRAAMRAAVLVVPPVLVCEALKLLLPRPVLHDAPDWLGRGTFPSGHVAFVVATMAFVYLMTPSWHRTASAAFGSVVIFAITLLVVASAMHRPSDALGGVIVSLAWVSFAVPIVSVQFDNNEIPDRSWRPLALACVLVGLGIAATTPVAPLLPATRVVDRAFLGTALLLVAMTFHYLTMIVNVSNGLMISVCDSVRLDSHNDVAPETSTPSPPTAGG